MQHKYYNLDEIIFQDKPKRYGFKDIEGKKFNKLLVLGFAGKFLCANKLRPYWWCQCECGNIVKINGGHLRSQNTKSCGCSYYDVMVTHGMSISPEYNSYLGAKQRCETITNHKYKDYGGRGIEFLFTSFEEFFAELGERPEPKNLYSLDRIDVNGNYEKGNVRWATSKEQSRNQRDTHYLIYNGKTKTLVEWSEIASISQFTLRGRINRSWCVACALSIPVNKGKGENNTCSHR